MGKLWVAVTCAWWIWGCRGSVVEVRRACVFFFFGLGGGCCQMFENLECCKNQCKLIITVLFKHMHKSTYAQNQKMLCICSR